LYSGNVAVAVGTSVVENGWAGFINLVVHPLYRGRGIGIELVHQLTVWSAAQGATGLYLQVVNDNEPACRLYRKAGFAPFYAYHYLCEEDAE
jgi:ribosomal protein S18 acetylase RimI-like enzyme